MKKNAVLLFLILLFMSDAVYADNILKAEELVRKAQTAKLQEESYEYLNMARTLYTDEYDLNPINTRVLIGLSKVNQMLKDRREAKLYILKAYNLHPEDSKIQKAMGDFYFSFQEYSTAVEFYKLALSTGLLRDFETNLQTAKCYEKLGDITNAELYYKISQHVNPNSVEAKNKMNEYESAKYPDNSAELDNLKYKYLFKEKPLSEEEQTEKDTEDIIESINSGY